MSLYTLPADWTDPKTFQMDNIVLHWTASRRRDADVAYASEHYHAGIAPGGRVVFANDPRLNWRAEGETVGDGGLYIPHTGRFNTRSIGLFITGMFGSEDGGDIENGFTADEVDTFCLFAAWMADTYGIPTERIYIHSAIRPLFGVGSAKWDINWTPQTGHLEWRESLEWFRDQINAARAAGLGDGGSGYHRRAVDLLSEYREHILGEEEDTTGVWEMIQGLINYHKSRQ